MVLKQQNITLSCTPQWKEGRCKQADDSAETELERKLNRKDMKYTDRELEDILNKLIASTRSPRGRFSAASSYPQLEKS